MPAVLPLNAVRIADEFEVGLVNKARCRERTGGVLTSQIATRKALELVVHKREQLVKHFRTPGPQWLGNQVEETRALAAAACDTGAIAASSFGAGFGGSVWALVPATDADAFGLAWLADYRRRCRTVSPSNLEWFIARPGPALTEVPMT